jgi:hypothetical protein
MVVDGHVDGAKECVPGNTTINGKTRKVTYVIAKRLLTLSRQRSKCLHEYLVQFDGCRVKNLAEWVDEDNLKDGMEVINEFGTITVTTYYCYYYYQ